MNRVLSIVLGIALAVLFLFLLPYILLAGIASIVLLRLLFGRRRKARPAAQNITNSFGQRYQQAYAMHWQRMTASEREDFLNRNAPVKI